MAEYGQDGIEFHAASAGIDFPGGADVFLNGDGDFTSTGSGSSALSPLLGTGLGGTWDLDGTNTYPSLSKSGNVYTYNTQEFDFPDNIIVRAGSTLIATHFPIIASATITVEVGGTIRQRAVGNGVGGNATAATGGSGGTDVGGAGIILTPGKNGGAGGTTTGTSGVSVTGVEYGNGGNGGNGGLSPGGAGAAGGISFISSRAYAKLLPFSVMGAVIGNVLHPFAAGAGGGGGRGDGTNRGGGGGAGGGLLIINCNVLINDGTISSTGANGGAQTTTGDCGGGGGGGGGTIITNTISPVSGSGIFSVAGGTGGAGFGTGGSGSSGSAGLVINNTWPA